MLVGHVEPDGDGTGQSGRDLCSIVKGFVGDNDARAAPMRRQGGCSTDAAGGAGDQNNLIFQIDAQRGLRSQGAVL
jgi:hypothetical protein